MCEHISFVWELFEKLVQGKTDEFFEHVADNVKWTVMGTHALAGTYHNKKTFLNRALGEVRKRLRGAWVLKIRNMVFSGDTVVVEMESLSTALNGKPFNNTYCWILRFEGNKVVEVRAYVDSALVQKLIDENRVE